MALNAAMQVEQVPRTARGGTNRQPETGLTESQGTETGLAGRTGVLKMGTARRNQSRRPQNP